MRRSATLGSRYAPFILLAAVQALLVAVVPSVGRERNAQVASLAPGGSFEGTAGSGSSPATGAGDAAAAGGAGVGAGAGGGSAGGAAGAGPGAAGPSGSGAAAPGRTAGGAATGQPSGSAARPAGWDPREPGAWPWAHSWTVQGDRAKCAPGGQLQDAKLDMSPPCTPAFTGDNGGATAQGVTGDTVLGVYYLPADNPAGNAILAQTGLAATPQQYAQAISAFDGYFNKHYEFYGRKLKTVVYQGQCDGVDPACMRNEARTINSKFHPFYVIYTFPQPPAFWDELSRLGIVNYGGWMLSGQFNAQHRPYHWDLFASGEQVAAHAAAYWCQKLNGKNATLAGDPTLQAKPRKLGLVVPADPNYSVAAEYLAKQVSGGRCAGPKPPIITYTASMSDTARAQEQATSVAVAMRQAGVTTVACVCDLFFPIFMTQAMDQQQYVPEHLLAGQEGMDNVTVGRLYSQNQWRHAFGPAMGPADKPSAEQDATKIWQEMGNSGDPPYVTTVSVLYVRLVAMQVQWAGPNLNALTLERGSAEGPQLGGWDNPAAWPGWQCCSKFRMMQKFGPGDYNGNKDAREIFWDSTAPSDQDGRPGAYICANGCRRYRVDQWPAGDPHP